MHLVQDFVGRGQTPGGWGHFEARYLLPPHLRAVRPLVFLDCPLFLLFRPPSYKIILSRYNIIRK